jgi:hypothetical protein
MSANIANAELRTIPVTITLTVTWEFTLRMLVGKQLIRLAAWVLGGSAAFKMTNIKRRR